MRTITATLFIALDGVVGGEEEMGMWHFPYFNEELGDAAMGAYKPADTVLLGRVTYDSFAGAWPDREKAGEEDAAFAKQLGDMRKVVVSNKELEFTWRNSEQLRGDLVEGVTALKNEPGDAGIVIPGSISLVRQLLNAGLVDRVHLMVHPIAARTGFRLFDQGQPPIPLKLISSQAFQTGVLNLVYAPAAAPGDAGYEDAKSHVPQSDQ
ncbi:MAG TPA: dihydrofolate reductase family protein [Acidimicrobiales bacterium]|nr:dihydrofolate reductase family protein [Acidimicrobiales bacterium]